MKCCAKGCKNKAIYVWIDAYLETPTTIIRGEFSGFPLCGDHDDKMHEFIDKLKIKPNFWLEKRIKIK